MTVPDLELPAIASPDRPVPPVSSEEALRWRIAKAEGTKVIPRTRPQGQPFVWIESVQSTPQH